MNDTKNIVLAWASSVTTVFAAIESRTLLTIVSVFVLPSIFFAIGKAIDVMLQIHLKREKK
ncbi:MAG: hypothetical protein ABJA02_06330 [Acidobacteriota bacterium]